MTLPLSLLFVLSLSLLVAPSLSSVLVAATSNVSEVPRAESEEEAPVLTFEDVYHLADLGLMDRSVVDKLREAFIARKEVISRGGSAEEGMEAMDKVLLDVVAKEEEHHDSLWAYSKEATSTAFSYFTLANFLYLVGFLLGLFALVMFSQFLNAIFGRLTGLILDAAASAVFYELIPHLRSNEKVFFLNLCYILSSSFHSLALGHFFQSQRQERPSKLQEIVVVLPNLLSLCYFGYFTSASVEGETRMTQWAAWMFGACLFGLRFLSSFKKVDHRKASKRTIFILHYLFPALLSLVPPAIVYCLHPFSNWGQIEDIHVLSLFPHISLYYFADFKPFYYADAAAVVSFLFLYWTRSVPYTLWLGLFTIYQIFMAAFLYGVYHRVLAAVSFLKKNTPLPHALFRWTDLLAAIALALQSVHPLVCDAVSYVHFEGQPYHKTNCLSVFAYWFFFSLMAHSFFAYSKISAMFRVESYWTNQKADAYSLAIFQRLPALSLAFHSAFIGDLTSADCLLAPLPLALCVSTFCFSNVFGFVYRHFGGKYKREDIQGSKTLEMHCAVACLAASVILAVAFRGLSLLPSPLTSHFDDEKAKFFLISALRYAWLLSLLLASLCLYRLSWCVQRAGIAGLLCLGSAFVFLMIVKTIYPPFEFPGLLAVGAYFALEFSLTAAVGPLSNMQRARALMLHGAAFVAIGFVQYYVWDRSSDPAAPASSVDITPFALSPFSFFWFWDDPFRFHYAAFRPYFSPFPWSSYPYGYGGEYFLIASLLFSPAGPLRASYFLCGLASSHLGFLSYTIEKAKENNRLRRVFGTPVHVYFNLLCYALSLVSFTCGSVFPLYVVSILLFAILSDDNNPVHSYLWPSRRLTFALLLASSAYTLTTGTITVLVGIPFVAYFLVILFFVALDAVEKVSWKYVRELRPVGFFSLYNVLSLAIHVAIMVLGLVILEIGKDEKLSFTALFSAFNPFVILTSFPYISLLFYPFYFVFFILELFYSLLFWVPILSSLLNFVGSHFVGTVVTGSLTWIPGLVVLILAVPYHSKIIMTIIVSLILVLSRIFQLEMAYLAAVINIFLYVIQPAKWAQPNRQWNRKYFLYFLLDFGVSLSSSLSLMLVGFLVRSHGVVLLSLVDAISVFVRTFRGIRLQLFGGVTLAISLVVGAYLAFQGAALVEYFGSEAFVNVLFDFAASLQVPKSVLQAIRSPTSFTNADTVYLRGLITDVAADYVPCGLF